MQKSVRSFALVAALAFAVVPGARANQTGCNPHPQAASTSTQGSLSLIVTTVLTVLGL